MESWNHVIVPGVALFWADEDGSGHGVAEIAGVVHVGFSAFQAIRARGVTDPTALAGLSCLLLDPEAAGSVPVTQGTGAFAPELQSVWHPPRVEDGVLVYWRMAGRTADIVRVQLDLEQGRILDTVRGSSLITPPPTDPVALARAALAGKHDYKKALAALAVLAESGDPAAAEMVLEAATSHSNWRVRQGALGWVPKVPAPGAIAALIGVLEGDSDLYVREAAAVALGALGDPSSRKALKKASRGDEAAQVRTAASSALDALGPGGCGG